MDWNRNRIGAFQSGKGDYKVFNSSNTAIDNEVVKCIFTQNEGEVFVGTDFGFYFLNAGTGEIQGSFHDPFNNYSISNNVVWAIFEDDAGILWLATSIIRDKNNTKNCRISSFKSRRQTY